MSIIVMETILSAVLGIIFLASAVPKLRHPRGFILAVLEYRVLSTRLSWFYGRLVPPLECLLGLLLLTGTAVRSASAVVSLLLLSFLIAIGINLSRGRDLDCQCFGKTTGQRIGWRLLLQDATLLGAAIALAVVASEWVAPEPWSLFRLSGLFQTGSLWPLLGCVVATACAAALFGRSGFGRSRFGSGVVTNVARSRAKQSDTN